MVDPTHPDPTGANIHDRLIGVFADRLARNRSRFGAGGPDYHGVHLENIAPDGSELDLIITFRAGKKYCCSQAGCHIDFRDARSWSDLRKDMDAHRLHGSPLPTIRILRVVVEPGALFDPGGLRRPPRVSQGDVRDDGPFRPLTGSSGP